LSPSAVEGRPPKRIAVVGLGNELRRDDGVGPAVASRVLQVAGTRWGPTVSVTSVRDPLELLGQWDLVELGVVVDATCSAAPAGSISVSWLDLHDLGTGSPFREHDHCVASTHAIGLDGVWRLSNALGQAPLRTVLLGVEGEGFGDGWGLSRPVASSVDEAVSTVVKIVDDLVFELRGSVGNPAHM
jgi:hydrogenase maturation protease